MGLSLFRYLLFTSLIDDDDDVEHADGEEPKEGEKPQKKKKVGHFVCKKMQCKENYICIFFTLAV